MSHNDEDIVAVTVTFVDTFTSEGVQGELLIRCGNFITPALIRCSKPKEMENSETKNNERIMNDL